jgi:hypothetical protein
LYKSTGGIPRKSIKKVEKRELTPKVSQDPNFCTIPLPSNARRRKTKEN